MPDLVSMQPFCFAFMCNTVNPPPPPSTPPSPLGMEKTDISFANPSLFRVCYYHRFIWWSQIPISRRHPRYSTRLQVIRTRQNLCTRGNVAERHPPYLGKRTASRRRNLPLSVSLVARASKTLETGTQVSFRWGT